MTEPASVLAPPAAGRVRRWVTPVAVLLVFGVMIALLHHELRDFRYHDVIRQVRELPGRRVLLGLGLTALVYLVLPAYDWMALRYVGRVVPAGQSASRHRSPMRSARRSGSPR